MGSDEYEYGLKADLDMYAAEATGRYRRPIVCQDYDAPLDLFDRHLYEKSGLVLHALRTELGDPLFWRGVQMYLTTHAHGVVETRDLQRAMQQVSGRSLGRFFDQWLYQPGHPEIEIELLWEKGILTVRVKQTQSTSGGVPSSFELPLELDVADAKGQVARHSVRITERQQSFAIPTAGRPAFVVVDPRMRIIGELRLTVPNDMLREQLLKAPTARGRWLAAQALARSSDTLTLETLARKLSDEREFWGARAECAAALAKIRGPEGFAALSKAGQTSQRLLKRWAISGRPTPSLPSCLTRCATGAISSKRRLRGRSVERVKLPHSRSCWRCSSDRAGTTSFARGPSTAWPRSATIAQFRI